MSQYIYTMNGVSKTVPPKRQIIKDISLSFFPARRSACWPNGAGKSTVLKIMAGVDKDYQGEALRSRASRSAIWRRNWNWIEQDRARSGRGRVGEVLQAQAALDAIYAAYAEEGADFDALARNRNAWRPSWPRATRTCSNSSSKWRRRAAPAAVGGRHRQVCPAARSAASRVLAAAEQAGHAAAGRTDQPSRRRIGGMAGTVPCRHTGTVVAVTHDRYFLDNAAE
ncbi:MAG: ATP-binding cassette domain-containing protein [Aquabacterium sp.]